VRTMGILEDLDKKLDKEIADRKLGEGLPVEPDTDQMTGRKSFLSDPFLEVSSTQGAYRAKFTRLSNRMLRETALRDTIISSVIRHRRTQVESFCSIPHTRFDTGFTWIRRDGKDTEDADHAEISNMATWLYHCGDLAKTPPDDRTTMATQFGMMCQDALTFGHISMEKVRDKLGGLQRFRHVSGESVFHANRNMSPDAHKDLLSSQLTGLQATREGVVTPDVKPVKFLQVIDGKEIARFSDDTMIFRVFQPPSYIDNNGYSMSLVEACILSITRHLQAENYNALFFTHGFAARGLLHLKGNVSQQNLQMFRNQFNAVINGNNNSWRTPIIAGLDAVEWIPLAGTSRDMEYIQYTDHLIRSICAQAQIDPVEIGFEYLSRGTQQSTLNSPNNEWKLEASAERGLVPLLRFFEDIVNHDLMPEISPALHAKYLFKFIGLRSETKQQEVTRLQGEMSVHATLNDLLKQVKKNPMSVDMAGDVPLNQLWWSIVKETITIGEFREAFYGDKGASEREELKYIPSQAFLAWQQQLTMKSQQESQAKQQAEQAKVEEQKNNMQGASLQVPGGPSPAVPVK
jgi:hypothetical protein